MTSETFRPESVKKNYEDMPYPPRNPADEKHRLYHSTSSNLLVVNHHCFRGSKDFSEGFRCLVAGGGTGDDTIYLAEQLKDFDAEVVYVDVSESAREIAEERARIRGLDNITWVTDSLLRIDELDLGEFDYIQCGGVLHHIDPIEDGLAALRGAMKKGGAIMLTLYGKYGMQPVYEMQELLADLLPRDMEMQRKFALTRELIEALPDTNRFKRDLAVWKTDISHDGLGDTGLFFLLLHSKIPSFDVPELYALAESAGLELLSFFVNAESYDPLKLIDNENIRALVGKMNLRARQSLAEQLGTRIYRHDFFLGERPDAAASLDDEDNALVAFGTLLANAKPISESIVPGRELNYNDPVQSFKLMCTPITRFVFAHMDGSASIKKLHRIIRKSVPGVTKADVQRELRSIYELLHPKGYLYLIRKGHFGVKTPDYFKMI